MTTVNQCCLEGFTFHHVDPPLNRQAQKQKAKKATDKEMAGGDGGEEGDDEGDDDDANEAKVSFKVNRPRGVKKPKPGNTKKPVVVVRDEVIEVDDDSAPRAIGFSPSIGGLRGGK